MLQHLTAPLSDFDVTFFGERSPLIPCSGHPSARLSRDQTIPKVDFIRKIKFFSQIIKK